MNLPNKITLCRIFLIPLVMFFFMADFIPYGKLVAALIFIIAAVTDNIDGRIARKRNMVTDLGKFLDPIADKVLVMAGLLLLIAWPLNGVETRVASIYPYWLGIICVSLIFAREFLVSGFRQIAATKKIVLAAEKTGKVKAALQDVTIALYMIWSFVRVEFYETILPSAGALSCYAPAGSSDVYSKPQDFFAGQPIYKDVVDFSTKTPSNNTGVYYYEGRSAIATAAQKFYQGTDLDTVLKDAQAEVEFNMGQ